MSVTLVTEKFEMFTAKFDIHPLLHEISVENDNLTLVRGSRRLGGIINKIKRLLNNEFLYSERDQNEFPDYGIGPFWET